MKTVEIIPSLLAQTKEDFLENLKAVQQSVKMIQVDIADGQFVPNTTWADPKEISKHIKIDLDLELHLMVKDPLEELKKWEDVQQVKRVWVHAEIFDNNLETLDQLENILIQIENLYNWQIGLVLNPDTQISQVSLVLDHVYGVMFMGVKPGFQGQKFVPGVLEKIEKFKEQETGHFISVDGAVNKENLEDIIKSGVNAICPGSAIFKNDISPEESVKEMKELIEKIVRK